MSGNRPSEIDLLRTVASAARWAIDANGDDPVGRDGRAHVGLNWTMANGALNRALTALAEHYEIVGHHAADREQAAAIEADIKSVRVVSKAKAHAGEKK